MAETKETKTTTTAKKTITPAAGGVEAKLLEIQTRLFVPKDQKNDFGGYKYRSCEDIERAIKPLCKEFNCVLRFWESLEHIGDRVFIKSNLMLFDLDSRTNVMAMGFAEMGEGKKGMDQAQLTGACTSYARKYALAGMFMIDNEKDPDATNTHGKTEEAPETVTAQQMDAIRAELDRTGVAESVILDFIKKNALEYATQADYVKVMKKLKVTSNKEGA